MSLVPQDRYGPPLSNDTKIEPEALYLMSQSCLDQGRKNKILQIFTENMHIFKFSPKILGICNLDRVFTNHEKK